MHPAWQQGQPLSSSLSGLHGDDPQLLGKNSYNAVVPGELQGWPQSPQLSSMVGKNISPRETPALCTCCNFTAKWALFWFSTQGRTTKQGSHLCHIGNKNLSTLGNLHYIKLTWFCVSKSNLHCLFLIVISRGPSAASKLIILKKTQKNKEKKPNKRKHNHKTLSYHSGMCKSVFPGLLLTTFNSCSSATELLGQQIQTGIYMRLFMLTTSVLCIYQQEESYFGKQNLQTQAVLGSLQLSK